MVAFRNSRQVICTIVRVSESPVVDRTNFVASSARRPSDILAWADPYIAGLVAKLQHEVREERHARAMNHAEGCFERGSTELQADLDPPSPTTFDDEDLGYDAWRAIWDDVANESN